MTQEAFLTLIAPMEERLFRFACHFLQNEEEAKDAVQDSLVKLWENRDALTDIKNPEAWCIQVTKNTMLDGLKYKKRRRTEGLADQTEWKDHGSSEQQIKIEAANTGGFIRKIIHALPEKSRLFIQLRDIEGFAYSEIATIMDLSLGEVKIGIFRARQAIREKLQNSDL